MTKRVMNVGLFVALAVWGLMVTLLWAGMAHGAPASAPASQPAAVPLDNLAALARVIIGAINAHNWPVLVVCVCVGLLAFERHYKGLTGTKFSQWLGTKVGLFLSSLFTAVVTAAAGVAAQGWKAIGNACVVAAVVAGVNFLAQLAGPATRVAGVDYDGAAGAADRCGGGEVGGDHARLR